MNTSPKNAAENSIIKKLVFGGVVALLVAFSFGVTNAHRGGSTHGDWMHGYYSKDQCKRRGWKDLGFKNQGRCIKFFRSSSRSYNFSSSKKADVKVKNNNNQNASSGNAVNRGNTQGGDAESGEASNNNQTSNEVNITF